MIRSPPDVACSPATMSALSAGPYQVYTIDMPAEVPVNFLNPRPGTPLEIRPLTPAKDALKWIALFRIGLPDVILRYAGGRELTLGDLQEAGMSAGINALIVGNYLTTLGRAPEQDLEMLDRLSMPIGSLSKVL